MAQIPASVTAAVKADQAIIQKAFSSLTPTQLKALLPGGPPSGTTSSNPTANLTATLTAAGVSSSQINTITTDCQNLKNAMTTTDPTLQAKIAADKAAIVQGRRALLAHQCSRLRHAGHVLNRRWMGRSLLLAVNP